MPSSHIFRVSSRLFRSSSLAEDYSEEQRMRTRIMLHIFLRVLGLLSMFTGTVSLWSIRVAASSYRKYHKGIKWFFEFADNGFLLFGVYCVILFPSIDLIWPSKETKKEKYTSLTCMLLISIPLVLIFLLFITVDVATSGFDVTTVNAACVDRPSGCKCLRNIEGLDEYVAAHNESISEESSSNIDDNYIPSYFRSCQEFRHFLGAVIISLIVIYSTLVLEVAELFITIYFLKYVISKESLSQRRKGVLHQKRHLSLSSDSDDSFYVPIHNQPHVHLHRYNRPDVYYVYMGKNGTPII